MIRLKIITLVLVSIVVLTVTLYVVSTKVILHSYTLIERNAVVENLRRAESAFTNYNTSLNIKLRDWAQWDDTYAFVNDGNQDYVDSNLRDETLVNLEINMLMHVRTDKTIAFSKMIDFESESEIPSISFGEKLVKRGAAEHNNIDSSIGGIIGDSDRMFIFQSLPILQSSGEGPVSGTLIFGRYFDETMERRFEELTQLSIDTFMYESLTLPTDVSNAKEGFGADDRHVIIPLDEQTIAGYVILHDINGTKIAILRIILPRDIYTQGQKTLISFLMIAGSFILLFGCLILIVIERIIINRFERLTREVESIHSHSDISTVQVFEGPHDEIGKLARRINRMLSELLTAQQRERTASTEREEAHATLERHTNELEKINKLLVGRELKMIELKTEISTLKGERDTPKGTDNT